MSEYRVLVAVESSVFNKIYRDFCWEEYLCPLESGYLQTFKVSDILKVLKERDFDYNKHEFKLFEDKIFDIHLSHNTRFVLDC